MQRSNAMCSALQTITPLYIKSAFIQVTDWPFHSGLIPECSMMLYFSDHHVNL